VLCQLVLDSISFCFFFLDCSYVVLSCVIVVVVPTFFFSCGSGQLVALHGRAPSLVVIANGARSVLRDSLTTVDRHQMQYLAQVQYSTIVDKKSETPLLGEQQREQQQASNQGDRRKKKKMDRLTEFLPTAALQSCPTMQELVDTKTDVVRLRLLIDKAEYESMQNATVKEPITSADFDKRVPAQLKESIAIWVNARGRLFGEHLEPASLRLSCFAIEVAIAKQLWHRFQPNQCSQQQFANSKTQSLPAIPVPVYIVGDAACALPCTFRIESG
jgi:hypothetical protein